MVKENNTIRYVVRNTKGEYLSSYSTVLGSNTAYKYAKECARLSRAILYSQDNHGNERNIYDNLKD